MKKFALALSTALLLGGLAGPAAAFVTDRQDLVSATDEQKLKSALDRLGSHRFEVLFVDQTSGAPSATAKKFFREQGLGDKDGVIVVAVQAKKVGVHVGDGFTRRGVTDSVVSERIKSDFLPYARKGEYARGAATLAKGLVDAGGKSSSQHSSEPTDEDGVLGLILILLFVGVPIGGFVIWRRMRNSSLKESRERLDALREGRELIVNGAIKLAEIDQLARFQEGEIQQAYQKLAKVSHQTLERARKFGDKFDAAEDALKRKQTDEAGKELDWLEREATTLGAHVSASLTTLERLEAGGLTGAQALEAVSFPERVQDLAHRLADVGALVSRESKRAAEVSVKPLPALTGAIGKAHGVLRQQPVDVLELEKQVAKAESLSQDFLGYIAVAEERHREAEARRAEEARANAESAAWTAAAVASVSHHDHHHHHESSSSWGGSSSDDSWGSDSGSSSSDSWGSDSGGSSSDDNW